MNEPLGFEARQEHRHVMVTMRQPPDPVERQGKWRLQPQGQRAWEVQIDATLRRRGLVVLKPRLPKRRWIPMPNEAWVSKAEVGEGFRLNAVRV